MSSEWGCYYYMVGVVGQNSIASHDHSVDLQSVLVLGDTEITLTQRKREYSYYFDRHNQAYEPNRGCVDEFSADCLLQDAGVTIHIYEGSVSEDYTSLDSEVVYMDLRQDLVVVKHTTNNITFDRTDNKVPGSLMVVDDIQGRIFPYSPMDVVALMGDKKKDTTTELKVYSSNSFAEDTVYTETETASVEMNMGVSDHTGFYALTNTINPYMYAWESYGVVDTRYPYSYEEGFVELFPIPHGETFDTTPASYEYSARWNNTGVWDTDYLFDDAYKWTRTNVWPIVIPVNFSTTLLGSFTFDRNGNYFASMLTDKTPRVYYKLTEGDPVTLTELENIDPLFYPIGAI